MDCFNSLIGLKGIANGNTATLFLEQVGVTADLLAKANFTHVDVETLLTDKINEATNTVASQIKAANAQRIKTFDNLANDRVGHPSRLLTAEPAKTGYWSGAEIELTKDSDFVKINIDSVSLFVNTTGNVDVKIYDLTEGRLLNTITVAAVSGEMVYKDVNLSFSAQKRNLALALVYDSEFTSNYMSALSGGCLTCGGYVKRQNRYAQVSGVKFADGDAFTVTNATTTAETSGLSFTYSVQCDFEQWICRNRELFMMLCLYYTAYHIASYALMSTKLNSVSLDYRQSVEAIKQMNLDAYNSEFAAVFSAMKLPNNSDCFICKTQSTNPITL